MSDFRKAFLGTAIPLVVLSIIGTSLVAGEQDAGLVLWGIGVGLWVLLIITSIILAILRRGEIAGGMFAGVGIGFVALGISCFVNFSLAL